MSVPGPWECHAVRKKGPIFARFFSQARHLQSQPVLTRRRSAVANSQARRRSRPNRVLVRVFCLSCHVVERRRPGAARRQELTTAKVLAPEDVRRRLCVVLHVIYELPSFFWCGGVGTIRPEEPVRIPFVPNNGGVPLRVRSICLPFILVKAPSGQLRNLDVRCYRLARLDRTHARAAWKARKKSRRKSERV